MTRPDLLALSLVATVLGGACSDSASALEGIYQVSTWTQNEAGCDVEGASILADESQTIFYIKEEQFISEKFLNLNFCNDVADCETLASEKDTINLGNYILDKGSDKAGWRSSWYSGFGDQDGICSGDFVVTLLTSTAEGGVHLEERRTPAGGFPEANDGFCDDDDGEEAAEGQPCGSIEVFTATLLTELP